MSLELASNVEILRDRAALLARARAFFAERGVLEVDVPILSPFGSIDAYIDLIEANCCGKRMFLHSSPEYGMKRLLAEGIGDIYQMSHVFRDHESGTRHTSEFMMTEWYRIGFSLHQMIEETAQFIRLFLEDSPQDFEMISYADAFQKYIGHYPESIEQRDRLFAFEIEPQLGTDKLLVMTDFPKEQAALAQIGNNGKAERFEIFCNGVELANGYNELIDHQEQAKRFSIENAKREVLGKSPYPIDEAFLEAFEKGIPNCCGVAVGFDRLVMLRHELGEIREASSFFN